VPRSLSLVSAVIDGEPVAIAELLAILDCSLADALTAKDPELARAAASAGVMVGAAQSLLWGLVPPAGALAAWPPDAVLDGLTVATRGVSALAVPPERRRDVLAATQFLVRAHALLSGALR
jgi:hypothetical protein